MVLHYVAVEKVMAGYLRCLETHEAIVLPDLVCCGPNDCAHFFTWSACSCCIAQRSDSKLMLADHSSLFNVNVKALSCFSQMWCALKVADFHWTFTMFIESFGVTIGKNIVSCREQQNHPLHYAAWKNAWSWSSVNTCMIILGILACCSCLVLMDAVFQLSVGQWRCIFMPWTKATSSCVSSSFLSRASSSQRLSFAQ